MNMKEIAQLPQQFRTRSTELGMSVRKKEKK